METRRLLPRDNDPARPAPEVTSADRYTLEVGGERVELAWRGPNHSPDNIYIQGRRRRRGHHYLTARRGAPPASARSATRLAAAETRRPPSRVA
jgi:hypothetical protein